MTTLTKLIGGGSVLIGLLAIWGLSREPEKVPETVPSKDSSPPLCGALIRLSRQNLPASPVRVGIGNSHLAISTRQPEAQRWFDQGLNLLHDFWHIEAYRAFREVIKADSTCAMGYWGLAMCQPGFTSETNSEWQEAIQKARRFQDGLSPVEIGLIEATAKLLNGGPNGAFSAFEALAHQFPNQPEVVGLAAIMMRQANNDPNGPVGDAIKTMLEKALQRFPNHVGLLHYYVHIMELRPEFAQAIPAAEKMAKLAPQASHISHMPGHLYFRKGDYHRAIACYEQARAQEERYHQTEGIALDADQNYLHNLHFLAVAQAQAGLYQKALATAQTYARTALTTNALDAGTIMYLYEGRVLPALVHIRFWQWKKADEYLLALLNKVDQPIPHLLTKLYIQTLQSYCRGMEAIGRGDTQNARQHLSQLANWMAAYTQEGVKMQGRLEFKIINETYDIMDMARLELEGWCANADPTVAFQPRAFTEALALEERIGYDEPPRLIYPIAESLGRLHLRRGESQKAQEAFREGRRRHGFSEALIRQGSAL